jgi:glycosyltransferase involved in cell wall biosynthesis
MRAKLVVATTFPIFPVRGGGQARVLGLYGALARRGVDVDVVALVGRLDRGGAREVAPGVREIRVPKSPELDGAEWELQKRAGVPVTDLALALHPVLAQDYVAALQASARGASAVVASHPFSRPALAQATDLPLIYEAHNVEADLKDGMYSAEPALADRVRDVERTCIGAAHHVVVCTQRDARRLGELYGVLADRMVVVPNGTDPAAARFTRADERAERRARLGIEHQIAVFIGSWHEPNLVAIRDLLRVAPEHEQTRFVVLGSGGLAMAGEDIPANVDLCGTVDGGFMASVLSIATAALNPMRLGSGTNLKMLDYALAGVPLVSSVFGARGLEMEAGDHYLECDARDVGPALETLRVEARADTARRVESAHALVRERFSWDVIADRWLDSPLFAELLDPAEVRA